MAAEELDLAEEGGSKKKLLLIIGIVVVLLLLGGGGAFYFLGMPGSGDAGAAVAEQEAAEVRKEAIYVALDPSFTVNLQSGSDAKFLQIAVQTLVRESDLEEAIKTHGPLIRSQLLLLFGGKTSQELASLEGKQALQNEALEIIRTVVKDQAGMDGVESVMFTSFVMQ